MLNLYVSDKVQSTIKVLRTYPFVVLAAILAWGCFTYITYGEPDYNDAQYIKDAWKDTRLWISKLMMVSMLGISIFYSLELLIDQYKKSEWLSLIGIVLLLVIYYYLPQDFDGIYFPFKFFVIALISHLFVSYCAYLLRDEEQSFWEFNKKLFVSLVMTGIFTLVLLGGVMIAIVGIDNLFDFDIDSDFYVTVAFFLAVVGSVIIFLHFVQDGVDYLERKSEYPQVLKFFVLFILIPLLLIYGSILYAYLIKIILQWELPRGWVTYLVNAYSAFGILALLLVHPLKEISDKSWVRLFSNIFYYSLIPLVILMGIGIYTRISQYGVTESRYYVVMLTMWLLGIAIYNIFIKSAKIKVIPISLSIIALISLLMPYFNAFDLSLRSQYERFVDTVKEANILSGETVNYDTTIHSDDLQNIASMYGYLRRRAKLDKVSHLLGDKVKDDHGYISEYKFKDLFQKVEYKDVVTARSYVQLTNSLEGAGPFNAYRYDENIYMLPQIDGYRRLDYAIEDCIITFYEVGHINKPYTIELSKDGELLDQVSLKAWLESAIEQEITDHGRQREIKVDELSYQFMLGLYEVTIYLDHLSENHFENNNSYHYQGNALIKKMR